MNDRFDSIYAELLAKTGLEGEDLPGQLDRSQWSKLRERLAAIFKKKTRDEWCEIMEGSDVCFAPVLSMGEAPKHPHNLHRRTFIEHGGAIQAAPAPRFSRTPPELTCSAPHIGQDTESVCRELLGLSQEEIAQLQEEKVLY